MTICDTIKIQDNEKIIFSFNGALSQELIVKFGDVILEQSAGNKFLKTVLAVFIELAQNIMFYSQERAILENSSVGIGVIILSDNEDSFILRSANLIKNQNLEKFKDHFDKLVKMDPDSLKEFYKKRIKNFSGENSKGAGLGLIDIARKSSEMNLEVISNNKDQSKLVLEVIMNKKS